MAEGRSRSLWVHTSSILAILANAHRDPKTPAFQPADFDPYATPSKPKPDVTVPLASLKGLLTGPVTASVRSQPPAP